MEDRGGGPGRKKKAESVTRKRQSNRSLVQEEQDTFRE
jgi:hypothetical protein